MPSTPYDAKGLLTSAIRDDDPVIFIEHKLLYMTEGAGAGGGVTPSTSAWPTSGGPAGTAPSSPGRTWCPGPWKRPSCWRPRASRWRSSTPRSLVPLDRSAILESVRRTEHVVIVQEAVRRGGVASDMASIIQAEAFDYLDAPVEIVAGRNTPIPFSRGLEQACIPQVDDILAAVRRAVYA